MILVFVFHFLSNFLLLINKYHLLVTIRSNNRRCYLYLLYKLPYYVFICMVIKLYDPRHKMFKLKQINCLCKIPVNRNVHVSAVCEKHRRAGKTKTTRNRTQPLTYEMAWLPQHIAHTKNWNSWNTSTILDGPWTAETSLEDVFIRKFMVGTWHNLILTEIIIKRQYNIIRVAALVYQGIHPRKMYFLIGYSEELLSYWLQCPVKLEIQTVADRKSMVFKYI